MLHICFPSVRQRWGGARTALLALVLAAVGPAPLTLAASKSDFPACDGLEHPGRKKDGMRDEADEPISTMLRESPELTVQACTRALESERLRPEQALRRAHLLRARAAAYIDRDEPDKALADLDAAEAATAAMAGDRFFIRSMGASMKLLRAFALTQKNEVEKALPLARAAMESRPYSIAVQFGGARVLQAARPVGTPSPSPWTPLAKLQPDAIMTALLNDSEIGGYTGVVELAPRVPVRWPDTPLPPFVLNSANGADEFLSSTAAQLMISYARAATGDPAGAKRDLEEVRAKVKALLPAQASGQPGDVRSNRAQAIHRYVAAKGRQIEARIAVAENRQTDALAIILTEPQPKNAATLELFAALQAKRTAKDGPLPFDPALLQKELESGRLKRIGDQARSAMLAMESPRAVIDYSAARPNILGALVNGALTMGFGLLQGVDRTDGFQTTTNPDGTLKVEFVGRTPSRELVQEMTLLRAAEVTRAAGKSSFIIVSRNDYSRTTVVSQNGMQIRRIPAGFKTELTIRMLDGPGGKDGALDAVAVIDALGPFYYEAGKKG